MPKHTTSSLAGKASKPREDFPLFPHRNGQWAKKVRGRLHYFGGVAGDPSGQAALAQWLEAKDDLLAGRTPRPKSDSLTVADLCNHFLTHKRTLAGSGELAERTFQRYFANCKLLVDTFGKRRLVEDLTASDFQQLREKMTDRWGPVSVANEIQMTRSVFRYGYDAGLLKNPVRFGPGFKKPSAKTIRQTRTANGPRMFTREQIHAALEHAGPNMRAMLLLAINGGLGNTDLALLPTSAIDMEGGWLNYARAKTAIDRRIPLWPETVAAIRAALTERRSPKNSDDAGLLFIGRRGQSYVGNHKGYRVTQEWQRLADKAGIEGRTFYDARRTFQTVAEGSHDLTAVQAIMGHAPASGDMSAVYRQRVDDGRLRAVVDYVRAWVFGGEEYNNQAG